MWKKNDAQVKCCFSNIKSYVIFNVTYSKKFFRFSLATLDGFDFCQSQAHVGAGWLDGKNWLHWFFFLLFQFLLQLLLGQYSTRFFFLLKTKKKLHFYLFTIFVIFFFRVKCTINFRKSWFSKFKNSSNHSSMRQGAEYFQSIHLLKLS